MKTLTIITLWMLAVLTSFAQGVAMRSNSGRGTNTTLYGSTVIAAGGTIAGNGSGLTSLPAAQLTGTVPDITLDSNVVRSNVTTIRVGTGAGQYATAASYANFLGRQSGQYATNASSANFLGTYSGQYATAASYANFLGGYSGQYATAASSANFLGYQSGQYATAASSANFLGTYSGQYATAASSANFLGTYSGQYATNASSANFLGRQSGQYATNASSANFLGTYSGQYATDAARSIFLGPYSGTNRADTIWIDTKATVADGTYMPLILGYCDTRELIVNGKLTATNTATFPGDLYVNNLYYTNLTDYSDAPNSLADAVAIVTSHAVKDGKVDHSKLSPLAWGKRTFQRETGTFTTNTIAAVWSEEKRDEDGKVIEPARELEPAKEVVTPIMESITEPDPASRNVSKTISALCLTVANQQKQITELQTLASNLLERLVVLEKR